MATTIEDVYDKIGGMGRFQVASVILLSSCLFTIGWSMLQMTFAGALPDFTCKPEIDTISNVTSTRQSTAAINWTMNACSANGSSCSAFEYHTSSRTVITEWDLVCDLQWTKKVIISIQMVGVLIGAAICGQLGDRFGRKKVLYSFVLSHIVLNAIAAFSTSWIMFACLRFLLGICIGAVILIILPYQLEFLPLRWRPLIGVVPSWSVGVAFFATAAFIFNDWSYLHISCGIMSIPSLFGFFFVPESVRWLAVQGRIEEAERVILRIASLNKKEAPDNLRSVLLNVQEQQLSLKANSKRFTYVDLFRGWRSARVALVFFFIWFSMAVVYYGISFGVASLTGNLYINIFLLGVMEIPVQTTTFCLNNKIGRHKTTFMFFTLSFIPILGCLLFHLFAPSDVKGVAINVFSQFAKMMIGSAWSAVQVWGTESFPTVMRNIGCGFQSVGARIGGIIAPLIINLDTRMGESYAILSALLFVTMLITFTLPETKGKVLNDNLMQQQKREQEEEGEGAGEGKKEGEMDEVRDHDVSMKGKKNGAGKSLQCTQNGDEASLVLLGESERL